MKKIFLAIVFLVVLAAVNIPFLKCDKCGGSGRAITSLFLGCSRCNNDGKLSLVELAIDELKLNKKDPGKEINRGIDKAMDKINKQIGK